MGNDAAKSQEFSDRSLRIIVAFETHENCSGGTTRFSKIKGHGASEILKGLNRHLYKVLDCSTKISEQ